MDKATVEVISKLNAEQSRQFENLLKERDVSHDLKFKGVQKAIEAGLETVALELQKRNGVIGEMKDTLCEVKDDTSWWRFFQRNPKVTVVIFVFMLFGSFVLFGIKIDEDGIGVPLLQHWIEKIF